MYLTLAEFSLASFEIISKYLSGFQGWKGCLWIFQITFFWKCRFFWKDRKWKIKYSSITQTKNDYCEWFRFAYIDARKSAFDIYFNFINVHSNSGLYMICINFWIISLLTILKLYHWKSELIFLSFGIVLANIGLVCNYFF